jgi:hypothetical protein
MFTVSLASADLVGSSSGVDFQGVNSQVAFSNAPCRHKPGEVSDHKQTNECGRQGKEDMAHLEVPDQS